MRRKVRASDITLRAMHENPPKCVIRAMYKVIFKGIVRQWVCSGWINVRRATEKDYDRIPQVINE